MPLSPRHPLHLKILNLWYRLQELEAQALAVDHLDPERWEYAKDRRGRPLDGGILWNNIDRLNAELNALLDETGGEDDQAK